MANLIRCRLCYGTENWCKCAVGFTPNIDKKSSKTNDPVKNPSHYTSHPSGIEAIEVTRHYNFAVGNAIKYLWRAGLKDGNSNIQDLKKAIWYIEDEIKRLTSGQE